VISFQLMIGFLSRSRLCPSCWPVHPAREATHPGSEEGGRQFSRSGRSARFDFRPTPQSFNSPELSIGADNRRWPKERVSRGGFCPSLQSHSTSGARAKVLFPRRLDGRSNVRLPVDTSAPCYPATPTDTAIGDQRG